jgi:glycosyltransferase involved in cell wall biosynthesis
MLVVLTNIPTPYRTNFFNVLFSQLHANNEGFHVLYCAETEPDRSWKLYPEQNNYPFTIMKGIHLNIKGFYTHFNPPVIGKLIKLKPTNVIIAGSWNTPTMMLAAAFLKLSGKRIIFWSEGHVDSVGFKKGIVPFLRKKMYNLFDAFAVPNKKSQDYVTDYLGVRNKKFILLPNTVEDSFFLKNGPLENEAGLKQRLGLTYKKIAIQVAQLEDRKGVLELVNGWLNLINGLTNDWVLLLVGNGSKLNEISDLINNSPAGNTIKLIGHLKPGEVRDILHISDLFILATKKDPNPLSPIEAAFSGLPLILSSKAGNITEILKEGLNGYTLEHVNPQNITSILSRAFSMEFKELKLMGKQSQQIAEQNFKTTDVVNSLIWSLRNL